MVATPRGPSTRQLRDGVRGLCRSKLVAELGAIRPIIAAVDPGAAALAHHAIELVGQLVDGFVGVLARDPGNEVRTAEFDATLGHELGIDTLGTIVLKIDPNADQPMVMTQEPAALAEGGRTQGRGYFQVNAPHENHAGQGGGKGIEDLFFADCWVFHM